MQIEHKYMDPISLWMKKHIFIYILFMYNMYLYIYPIRVLGRA